MSIRPFRDIKRRKTKEINVGKVKVGGNNPISVQSMTNTLTTDIKATIQQINEIQSEGADIVRVSCPDESSSKSLKEISNNFTKLDEDHIKLKTWASTHIHPSTAASPGAPAVLTPGAVIPIAPVPSPTPLDIDVAKLKTDTDASSENNGGQEIQRLQGVIDNLYKMLSRFSKTT